MSTTPRGPTGEAPLPPADLALRRLPITEIGSDADLFRVHRSGLDPVFYGPGAGLPPVYRFDSPGGRFGVLYLAPGPDAALVETLLRQPQRLTVDYREIAVRSLSILRANRPLRLVAAQGANLSRLGTTAALATGPYDPCGAWADALFDHPETPDGLLFSSRHNPDETCIALFERKDIVLTRQKSIPLPDMLADVGRLLDRHGKSVFGAP
ncbi:RES family NAD+ phosphorylase [Rhodobacter sp. NSM]|uniref:RES family NAD+ phosphorylase n=1 Tax=Rhodobacter sp. NSM TaxID=3457501 RepID=UPI003FD1F75A